MASSLPPAQQANSLVSFLDTASKTITGLMDNSSKSNKRKVNHKKYLQKRLQRNPAQPKVAKQTKSKSAQLPPPPAATQAPPAAPPPILHHNSWPQLPGYSQQPAVEPDIDFLLQQLSSSSSDLPSITRPCSESSFYPLRSFAGPQQPPPVVSLESQVLIGEQPYGSPYTPSNSSVEEFLDDSAYSSPSSSIHSSPATVSLAHDWQPCPVTTTMAPVCLPTTSSETWGLPPSCVASCVASGSNWLPVSTSAITTACPMDQRLPIVPQLWDQINFCEQVHY